MITIFSIRYLYSYYIIVVRTCFHQVEPQPQHVVDELADFLLSYIYVLFVL